MLKSQEEWYETYQQYNAIWTHDNNPERPHALLKGGEHSSGFFNSELVMEDPVVLKHAAADLVKLLEDTTNTDLDTVNRIVGPAMGGITLASDIAFKVNEWRNSRYDFPRCLRAYTEKKDDGPDSPMFFNKTNIRPGEHIVLVEDVLTSGGSVGRTAKAVLEKGGVILPFVLVLVNRSGLKEVDGRLIIALIDRHMPKWDPNKVECPLCKIGSKALRPKENENWAALNAKY